MAKLDVLVVDLQDVGTRTWSYVSTTIFAMRAAKTAGKRIIVLDRPNPIGCAMQGPILDTAFSSMIGPLPVPLRHGMTMGELMRFANAELGIGADLVVVPVKGWHRCEWFDETGLPWVPPSPNLRDLDAVAWYPGTVLIEATNLSVGRGTDEAFREMGAPWLKTPREAYGYPNGDTLEHVTFTPHAPGDGKYDGVSCAGVRFWRNNRRYAGGPILEVIRVLRLLAQSNRDSLRVDSSMMTTRFGRAWNADSALAWASDQRALAAFRIRVRPYLLYL